MSLNHRVEFPGAIHHVFQRGSNREYIFKAEVIYRMTLDEILKNICPIMNDINLIRSGSRKHYLTNIKVEFIKTAIDNKYTFKVIGDFLGVSISVSHS